MKPLALAGLLALASLPAHAETVDGDLIRVIDGDTVELAGERIRLVEPDAPEISKPRCNTELAKGLLASGSLRQLLEGPVRIERSGRTDRYRRTLASIVAPAGNVADILIREGLAIPYKPGFDAYQQRAAHWCPEQGRGPTSPTQAGERS
jgi:endonuclease YncB( thermonuclease family)